DDGGRGEEEPHHELLHDVLHRCRAHRPLHRGVARRAHRGSGDLRRGRRDVARHRDRVRLPAEVVPVAPEARLREPGYHPCDREHSAGKSMTTLAGKTLFITGASRGIGREIALRAARDGARVAIAAKTTEPHPKLAGTIHSVASEVEAAGGKALAIQLDVRDADAIARAVETAAKTFGGIDTLVNNASAISLTPTAETPAKRFDLMMAVNARATFLCSQACIPWLRKAANPHILNLSPPLNMQPRWFAGHVAYTMSKYGMSMCT